MIVPDFKDRGGNWASCVYDGENPHRTKAGMLWHNMDRRCRKPHKKLYPSYELCENNFHNFQEFAEWCQSQVGYYEQGFQLDKDILVKGNKSYSKDTCAFVPPQINYLFLKCNRLRGAYPVGVVYLKDEGLFKAQMKIKKVTKCLGRAKTPEDAFKIYKTAKEALIKSYAEEYKNVISEQVYLSMINYEVEITD